VLRGAASDKSAHRQANHVERGPDGRGQKVVRYVHRFDFTVARLFKACDWLLPSKPYCTLAIRMGELSRIGVAIDSDLLEKFDHLIADRGYTNRSEAFRDLIRDELVEKAWEAPNSEVVGTVTLVYDHHVRMLSDKLTDLQHDHFHHILSTLHVHLDHDNCLEVLVVRGKASAVKKIADALISTKGVKHGRLTITSTGTGL
jgi:CopG family nickel-responsive transcriptional regulator